MINYLSIFILLFSFISSFGQRNVPDSIPIPVISLNWMNVVYVGMDNPFRIVVPGYSSDQIELKARGGEIRKGNGHYYLRVVHKRRKVQKAYIFVFVKENDSLIFIKKHTCLIKRVPNIEPCFGSKTGGEISAAEVQSVNFLRFNFDGFYYDINIRVQKYKFILQPLNGIQYVESVYGCLITETIKEKLKHAQSGDIIILANIFASYSYPGAKAKQLPGSIVLTIK